MAARVFSVEAVRLLKGLGKKTKGQYERFADFYLKAGGDPGKSEQEIKEEYEGLLAQAEGGKIEVTSEDIKIPLGFITSKDPYTGYEFGIGEFTVILLPKARKEIKIMAHNPDLARNHEAVFSGLPGSGILFPNGACLGNINLGIKKLVSEFEFVFAVDLARQFLETGRRRRRI